MTTATALPRVPATAQTPIAPITRARARARARPRAVDTSDIPAVRPEYEAALTDFVRANIASNAATRVADAAKKVLAKAMGTANVDTLSMLVDGRKWDATFMAGTVDYIDVAALYDKVDLAVFLQIVTASQGAVKDAVGSNVAAAVLKTKTTDVALKVKENKN